MRTSRLLGPVIAGGLLLTGCGPKDFPTDQIADDLANSYSEKVDVTCPEDVKSIPGTHFTCWYTVEGSDRQYIEVYIDDADGGFHFTMGGGRAIPQF